VGDFVVKLRGGMDRRLTALVSELIASKLAFYFGIAAPEPALVSIETGFADLVAATQPSHAKRIQQSAGLNFGSRLLTDVATWPVDKSIPAAMWTRAVSIFAFDALIQNPDRRFTPNPNLFSRGDEILVFDHELAFSFIEDIFPQAEPWRLDRCNFLTDHVFFRRLKRREIDLTGFTTRLSELPDSILPAVLAEVPPEWNDEKSARIEEHLVAVAGQAERFAEEIRRRLA
jgi:hypothetical protein